MFRLRKDLPEHTFGDGNTHFIRNGETVGFRDKEPKIHKSNYWKIDLPAFEADFYILSGLFTATCRALNRKELQMFYKIHNAKT